MEGAGLVVGGDHVGAAESAKSVTNSGYHYWHDKVPDGPKPEENKPIAVAAAASNAEDTAITISNFMFLDDDDKVKVYVELKGDLEGVTTENVTFEVERARYDPTCSMLLHIQAPRNGKLYRLYVSHLLHEVVPEECKVKVNVSKAKIIVTLKKKDAIGWEGLRSKMALPYKRGGGGGPSGGGGM